MTAKELEELGYPGPTHIKTTLSKTRKANTLINAVKKFQQDNGLKQESLAPALRLLDMHGVQRRDFHELVLTDLSEKLLQRIRSLGNDNTPESLKKLEDQLEQCFKMYKIPQIRPIVLETLKQLPKVPDRYLKIMVCDKDLYSECAMSVRQQIWIKNEEFFVPEVHPVIDSYLQDKKKVECLVEPSSTNFFTCETTKTRRQWPQVQTLIKMVGDHEQLYTKVVDIIREKYIETKNVHLCSLRVELIMAMHDVNVECIVRIDPCHELAWCLEGCVKNKHFETRRIKAVLDTKKHPYTPQQIGDLAMIAWDSHIVHSMCTMICKVLRDGVTMPRDSVSMQLLAKLLALGAASHTILSTGEVPQSLIDAIFLTKFMPAMTSLAIEDLTRFELMRANFSGDEYSPNNYLSEPSENVQTFLKAEVPAAVLWVHQCIEMLPSKRRTGDTKGLLRYVKYLNELKEKISAHGPWCHFFMHRFAGSIGFENILKDAEIQHYIVDQLFLGNLETDISVKYQLLRLIYTLYIVIGLPRCMEVMEKIAPANFPDMTADDKEKYEKDYAKTMTRITPKPVEEEHPHPMMHPGMTPGVQMMMTPAHPGMTPRVPGVMGPPIGPSAHPGQYGGPQGMGPPAHPGQYGGPQGMGPPMGPPHARLQRQPTASFQTPREWD